MIRCFKHVRDVPQHLFRASHFEQPTVDRLSVTVKARCWPMWISPMQVILVRYLGRCIGFFARGCVWSDADADLVGVVVCSVRSDPGNYLICGIDTVDIKRS